MASPLYARYVPPKTTRKITTSDTCATQELSKQKLLTSINTRPDASATYSRYIPSTKKDKNLTNDLNNPDNSVSTSTEAVAEDERHLPSQSKLTKKSKRETVLGIDIAQHAEISKELNQPPKKKRKSESVIRNNSIDVKDSSEINTHHPEVVNLPLRKPNQEIISLKSDLSDKVNNEDKKHTKLFKKREKSFKKAQKVAKDVPKNHDIKEVPIDVDTIHDLVPLPQPEPIPEPNHVSTVNLLPPWLANPTRVSPHTKAEFKEFALEDHVIKSLCASGFSGAFAVQAAVLPLLLPGVDQHVGDVVISAATGSGKTLAYVLPMVQDISRYRISKLRGLIILPTRDLVSQAKEVVEICAAAFSDGDHKRIQVGTAIGNENLKVEQHKLIEQCQKYDPEEYKKLKHQADLPWQGTEDLNGGFVNICDENLSTCLPDHVIDYRVRVNVLICTPGRLVEHLKSTPGFTIKDVRWLVIDEADKLLDQSFQQWLPMALAEMEPRQTDLACARERIKKVVLSATMTRDVGKLTQLKLYRPRLVLLEGQSASNDNPYAHTLPSLLLESGVKVEEDSIKPLYLMELLKRESIVEFPSTKDSSSSSDSDDSTSSSSSDSDSDNSSSSSSPSSDSDSESNSDSDSDDSDSSCSSSSSSPSSSDSSAISSQAIRCLQINNLDTPRGVLIFTNSNETAVRLGRLIALMYPSWASLIGTLTSTLPRSSRQRCIQGFTRKKKTILVASDLASRGLDLPNLAHVINYDVPTSLVSYIHRVGRTARAGKMGHAWTLFSSTEGRWFWNEIGRSPNVHRPRGKVERTNIKKDIFSDEQRERYVIALEKLEIEAKNISL